ncbi:hypothetical protein LXL04_022070 [Taraxacum kok-saghyz]
MRQSKYVKGFRKPAMTSRAAHVGVRQQRIGDGFDRVYRKVEDDEENQIGEVDGEIEVDSTRIKKPRPTPLRPPIRDLRRRPTPLDLRFRAASGEFQLCPPIPRCIKRFGGENREGEEGRSIASYFGDLICKYLELELELVGSGGSETGTVRFQILKFRIWSDQIQIQFPKYGICYPPGTWYLVGSHSFTSHDISLQFTSSPSGFSIAATNFFIAATLHRDLSVVHVFLISIVPQTPSQNLDCGDSYAFTESPSRSLVMEEQPTDRESEVEQQKDPEVKDKRKAEVWHKFDVGRDPKTNKITKASCKFCSIDLKVTTNTGTSSMLKHLKSCNGHPNNIDSRQPKISMFKSSQSEGTTVSKWEFNQASTRQALTKMIFIDEQPFSYVERAGFRLFCSVAVPQFSLPSRYTVAKDIGKLYLSEMDNVRNTLKCVKSRIAITTDCWTSVQNLNYMVLTAHFIDDNWKLHKRILNFKVMDSHKRKEIGKVLESCILKWGIEDKLSCITVDNASANDVAVAYLKENLGDKLILGGEFFHMRCAAHILNLIVKDGLNMVKDSINCIRAVCVHVRSSTERSKLFDDCQKIPYKGSLSLDNNTRWNSTYLMLDRAIKFEKVFKRMKQEDPNIEKELKYGFLRPPGFKKCTTYKVLSSMVKDILAVPVSTVASESAFSTSGRVVDDFRSSLGVKTVEALICTQDWLRASNVCIDLEQLLEDVEKYEKDIGDTIDEAIGQIYVVKRQKRPVPVPTKSCSSSKNSGFGLTSSSSRSQNQRSASSSSRS